MIDSFRDSWLEAFMRLDQKGKEIPSNIDKQLFRRLRMLDDATCGRDLWNVPGNCFEHLSGALSGKCSIRVNLQWRLIFEFDEKTGQATDVYLDPHTYRR